MKTKKIIAAVLSSVMCLTALTACGGSKQSLSAIKKAGTITMYTNAAFPPFESKDGEKVVGVDADIAAEIAKDIGVKLEIKDVEFTSALTAISTGKGSFAAAGISVTAERKKSMDFSEPYVTSVQYIIVPEATEVKVFEDLKGMTIGTQTGTTGDFLVMDQVDGSEDDSGNAVKGVIQDTGASYKQYTSGMNAVQDMQAGRIDAVVIDKMPAQAMVAKNKGLKCLELVYADGTKTEEQYAIAVQKGNKELLDQINKTIDRLVKEGKIEEYIVEHSK